MRLPSDIGLANLVTHLNTHFIRMVFIFKFAASIAFPLARRGTSASFVPTMVMIGKDELYLT